MLLLAAGCSSPESTVSAAEPADAGERPGMTVARADTDTTMPSRPEGQVEAAVVDALLDAAEPSAPATARRNPAQPEVIQTAQAAGSPRIVVEEPVFNFGSLEVGESIDHVWTIRNDGDVDLEISNVRAACGCTNTNLASRVIAPGESTTLSSTLEMPRQMGDVRKSIALSSNDPNARTTVVSFEGRATQAIAVEPHVLAFRDIDENALLTMSAEITSQDGTAFQVEEVSAEQGLFDLEWETVEQGTHYRVHVTTRPPFEASYVTDRISIKTDHPRLGTLQMAAVANVSRDLNTAPEVLRMSSATTGPINRMVLIRAGRVSEFSVTGVEVPDPEMTYEVTQRQPGMLYIEIKNIVAKPELNGAELIVHTDVPTMPEVRIPFEVVQTEEAITPGVQYIESAG